VTAAEDRNGNATEAFDPEHPDVMVLAGVVARIDATLAAQGAEQARQGRLLNRIAQSFGIEVEKSDPPPNFRSQLDSYREDIAELRKADAETTGSIKAVTEDVAATKLVIRVGLIEGVPKLVKVGVGLTAAIGALTLLASQIWAALR
jgi:hypothetical protein